MKTGVAWLAAIVILAGCASSSPSASSLPLRPPVPDGWVRYTSDTRDVAVTVPPELQVQDDHGSILAGYSHPAPDFSSFGVLAIGPTQELPAVEPPYTESRLVEWLLTIVSNRRPETYTHASIVLPEGPAVEVRFTFDAGTPDEVAVVADAFPTAEGVAYLMANCQAEPMTLCDEYLHLVPWLFELNRPTAD
jgi:hypothetical protein